MSVDVGVSVQAEKIEFAYETDWLGTAEPQAEDALRDLFDPHVTFVPEQGSGPAIVGIGELIRLLAAGREDCESCWYLVEDVEPVGESGAIVSGRVVADLRRSHSRVSFPFVHAWHADGDRFDRIEAHRDRDEAVQAFDVEAPALAV